MKMSHPLLIVLLVLCLAPTDARPAPWPPIIIDDFQEGIFALTQGDVFLTQTGLAPQSCIGGERAVRITSDNSARSLTLFGGDVALHVIGSAASRPSNLVVLLFYEFPIRDFTQNGGLDRIVLDVENVVGDMSVEVILNDEPGGISVSGWAFSGPVPLHAGQIQIPLSRFIGGMDVSRVRQAIFHFRVDNEGELADVTIKRIRVRTRTLAGVRISLIENVQ